MTAYKEGDPTTLNRLYGRSIGKPLRAHQQGLVDNLLPRIAVPDEGPVTAERLFGDSRPLHFEIGFGGGEHLANADIEGGYGGGNVGLMGAVANGAIDSGGRVRGVIPSRLQGREIEHPSSTPPWRRRAAKPW